MSTEPSEKLFRRKQGATERAGRHVGFRRNVPPAGRTSSNRGAAWRCAGLPCGMPPAHLTRHGFPRRRASRRRLPSHGERAARPDPSPGSEASGMPTRSRPGTRRSPTRLAADVPHDLLGTLALSPRRRRRAARSRGAGAGRPQRPAPFAPGAAQSARDPRGDRPRRGLSLDGLAADPLRPPGRRAPAGRQSRARPLPRHGSHGASARGAATRAVARPARPPVETAPTARRATAPSGSPPCSTEWRRRAPPAAPRSASPRR